MLSVCEGGTCTYLQQIPSRRPTRLRARRCIRSSLRLVAFPSLINLRMYPFVQPGRTCTVFQPNTAPASAFFGTIAFSGFGDLRQSAKSLTAPEPVLSDFTN